MAWKYRVIQRKYKDEVIFAIYEVYYDNNGKPNGMTEQPSYPHGYSLQELKKYLKKYILALDEPILQWDDFE